MRQCSTCKYEELSTFQEPCDSCCWERSGYEPKERSEETMTDIWSSLSKVYNMEGVPEEAKEIIGNVMLAIDEEKYLLQDDDSTEAVDFALGDRIKILLDRRGMAQRELADRIGCTEVSVSRYITGARMPKAPTLAKIAKVLGVSADVLLGIVG